MLLISHTCQSRREGQEKAHALARCPDVELHLLVPQRWKHYGQWREAEPPMDAAFQYTIAPVRFPWLFGAQCFLHHYPRLPQILQSFRPDIIDLWEEPWSYVSAHACKWRNRLLPQCRIVAETELDAVCATLEAERPDVCVVDSVQTLHAAGLGSAPGSVAQVREAAGRLLRTAKELGVTVVLVGHVTKDGAVRRPACP